MHTPPGGVAPVRQRPRLPGDGRRCSRAIGQAFDTDPADVLFTREGGSGPEADLVEELGAPLLFLGAGLPTDRIHSPNERVLLPMLYRGAEAAAHLWRELARSRARPPVQRIHRRRNDRLASDRHCSRCSAPPALGRVSPRLFQTSAAARPGAAEQRRVVVQSPRGTCARARRR